MRHFLSIVMALAVVALAGCDDTDLSNGKDGVVEITEDPGKSPMAGVKIQRPFCVLGVEDTPFFSALKERCENLVGIGEAELVFVPGNAVGANSGALLEAYGRGADIAVVSPEVGELKDWCEERGIPFVARSADKLMLYVFNKARRFYTLDTLPESFHVDDFSPMTDSFVGWVTKVLKPRAATDDIQALFSSQSITHAFNICLNETIATVALSKPDVLAKYSTVDVSYNIYPMHACNVPQTGAEGDYYVVEAGVTSHNSNMYNGQWTSKHGGVHARLCGFYMSSLQTKASLVKKDGTTYSLQPNVAFPAGASPKPETTVGSTSYTDELSWTVSGSLNVGVADKSPTATLDIGGSCHFGSSETRNVSDVNISKNTTDGIVEYTYAIQNLPTKAGPANKHPNIPEVAKADFSMYSTWVWYVKDAKEYDTVNHAIKIEIVPKFKAYHWYSSGADYADYEFTADVSNGASYQMDLIAPSRIPTGELTFTNTSKTHQYVRDIKIWKKANEGKDTPDYAPDGVVASSYMTSSGSNTEVSQVLPVGDYVVEFTCYNVDIDGKRKDEVKRRTSLPLNIADSKVIDCGSGVFD